MQTVQLTGIALTLLLFLPVVYKGVTLINAVRTYRRRDKAILNTALTTLPFWLRTSEDKIPFVNLQNLLSCCGDSVTIVITDTQVIVRGTRYPEMAITIPKDKFIF